VKHRLAAIALVLTIFSPAAKNPLLAQTPSGLSPPIRETQVPAPATLLTLLLLPHLHPPLRKDKIHSQVACHRNLFPAFFRFRSKMPSIAA